MKLQNFTVLFIIIVFPVIIVTSYYMSLQISTANMQSEYNQKILDSAKQSIDAYEINTVEWNSDFSTHPDSQRRDVMAAIDTFVTALANNMGIGGASKQSILPYIPAIAFTLYDGFYIYSPANVQNTSLDTDGVTIFDADGNPTFDGTTEYKHVLKPFTAYSRTYNNGADTMIINYTLDNYIKVYEPQNGIAREGYVTNLVNVTENSVNGITYAGSAITPETLTENIAYANNNGDPIVLRENVNYIYESQNKIKVYIDGGTCFILDDGIRRDITQPRTYFKKVLVRTSSTGYIELYQDLATFEWFTINPGDEVNEYNLQPAGYTPATYGVDTSIKLDYSAINYCVEAVTFSNWFRNELVDIELRKIFEFVDSKDNPATIIDESNTRFLEERRDVICGENGILQLNLQNAINSYSRNSAGNYSMPNLTEPDWDQLLRNVSILAFVQNIPIGTKTYNNYVVATSTRNREFVDENEIYLIDEASDDTFYHRLDCNSFINASNGTVGYRSIDFTPYTFQENNTSPYTYYYMHNIHLGCYNCIVHIHWSDTHAGVPNNEEAYYKALARERYVIHK